MDPIRNGRPGPSRAYERGGARIRARAAALLIALAGWQLAAVWWVELDYYDGLETILNARAWLGLAPEWSIARWPLLPLLLVPAEALRDPLGLDALDLRIDHAVMAGLHIALLVGTWRSLLRIGGPTRASLLAFVAAMPTYVFFAYAPFVSNDLTPGLLLLWMLRCRAYV